MSADPPLRDGDLSAEKNSHSSDYSARGAKKQISSENQYEREQVLSAAGTVAVREDSLISSCRTRGTCECVVILAFGILGTREESAIFVYRTLGARDGSVISAARFIGTEYCKTTGIYESVAESK